LPHGVYKLDREYDFNVLDAVYYDAGSRQISLVGHRDEHFKGPRIPYLQHLATLLENPNPKFTLNLTPESYRHAAAYFNWSPSRQEADKFNKQLYDIIDPNGNVTPNGRYMLPSFGVYPARENKAPGYLGVESQLTKDGLTAVTRVALNSPAAKAGIIPGDLITFFDDGPIVRPTDRPVYNPLDLARRVHFAGAGTTLDLTYQRGVQPFKKAITLTTDSKDPWLGFTRFEALAALYRAAGNENAARVIDAFVLLHESPMGNPVLAVTLPKFSAALNLTAETSDVARGQALARRLDEIFALPGNPVLAAYDANYAVTRNAVAAIRPALARFEAALTPKIIELLERPLNQPEGFQIPPEVVERLWNVRVEMTPEYRGVPADSLLARAMFEGDYLTKRLTNQQDLKLKFPSYQTEFEYKQTHGLNKDAAAFRTWISVAKLDVAQSSNGDTLELRDVQMRYNIHKLGKDGIDLPDQQPNGYENLLSSLYPDFAQEYPVLHELREIAKLTVASAWLRGKTPSLRLPKDGAVKWRGPAKVPGLAYTYLYNRDRKFLYQMVVEGGVNLNLEPMLWPTTGVVDARGTPGAGPLPHGAPLIPIDPSIVDLRGDHNTSPLIVMPEVFQNDALRKILHTPINVPVPRPVGWVARSNKGDRSLQSISLMINSISAVCAEESLEQRNKMQVAQAIARRLKQTELALNILTQDTADRALQFQTLQDQLTTEMAAEQKELLNTLQEWGHEFRWRIADRGDLTEDTKTVIESFSAVDSIEEAKTKTSGRAIFEIVNDLAKNWAREVTAVSSTGERIALKPLFNAVADIKLVHTTLQLAALNDRLDFIADVKIPELDKQQSAASEALRKKLIPLQKELSAQLDAALHDSALNQPKTCGATGAAH
jgi:hypothetical protein